LSDSTILRGQVKWFDAGKGFGFVVAEGGGPDILLHANVLRNYGQSSIADGALVEIAVQETARGVQATEILSITPPPREQAAAAAEAADEAPRADGPLLPARVKWFDKSKGFGFANVFGRAEDVFVHMEVLRACGMADLLPGEAICLRVTEGPRGAMAAEVRSWEFAQRGRGPA
jgi:CspA family cold shock protein